MLKSPRMVDEVREFHLDGKQLAFLVISAIGLAVVVFLCGVMVGRGVRQPQIPESSVSSTLVDPALDLPASELEPPLGTDGKSGASKDSFADAPRLSDGPVPGLLSEPLPTPGLPTAAASPTTAASSTTSPPPKPTPNKTPSAPASAPVAKPDKVKKAQAAGFSVQVASVTTRAEAEKRVEQLASKEYKSYITEATDNRGHWFRVRVGPFPTRQEATAVAKRLEKGAGKEKPWVDVAP